MMEQLTAQTACYLRSGNEIVGDFLCSPIIFNLTPIFWTCITLIAITLFVHKKKRRYIPLVFIGGFIFLILLKLAIVFMIFNNDLSKLEIIERAINWIFSQPFSVNLSPLGIP